MDTTTTTAQDLPGFASEVPAHVAAIRAERNQRPLVHAHRLCLDCMDPESARQHRERARDIWDIPRHRFVAPDPSTFHAAQ